jgi:GNAT superfamily N-acetyltransferase
MLKILAFTDEYIKDAADIFADNYKLLREANPELPIKYEKPDAIVPALKNIIERNPSAVAMEGDRVLGYMTGYAGIKEYKGSALGVYIPEWGHSSLASDNKELIYYELYSYLSKQWVERKNYTHCITFYSKDSTLKELFYNLCFGLLVIDGLMPVQQIKTSEMDEVVIREAESRDFPGLSELDKSINAHLNKSPIFLYKPKAEADIEELKSEFFNDEVKTFIAEKQGKIVSCIRGMLGKGPNVDIVQDKDTLGIDFGYTSADMRGSGIATNVLAKLIEWGLNNGMKRCAVDFESQNREAAAFWLRHFKPICHSVIRKVDDRV